VAGRHSGNREPATDHDDRRHRSQYVMPALSAGDASTHLRSTVDRRLIL
jgi:hypothetical protein